MIHNSIHPLLHPLLTRHSSGQHLDLFISLNGVQCHAGSPAELKQAMLRRKAYRVLAFGEHEVVLVDTVHIAVGTSNLAQLEDVKEIRN